MQFHLDDMTCGGCARTVTKAIQTIDPNANVVTDPPTRRVEVQTSASEEQIATALREAGFPPRAQ
ncbi:TPA: heavy-metal-associated domain-containing protein [Pseudomonas aeruginosa]|uniref:heavy-metal-associated domain-containing protein n=1 Tax=Pseudomonas TaxID=286 RepID=UPI00106B6DD0|nr:heavy-metal-associated domain-containing protein [Pseudomonas aeruginosa]MBG5754389.1 heavy-metal-associated domain-containing protein [Pseudomonas aeruginosa]MBH9109093.1 heavy-metal-associated domain-containing protein [Pseudomonas aeruginosa]MBH9458837.1 heavy-metal-associated domain-containing protein [Pseudomonas aeruginosa]MBH9463838.1 heavy-metal-associated domain-containing protein [Pseudomonas aeruginosa]MCO3283330.1 heavy-metal-associated domain-containing protein [Pseudomonas aer